MAAAPRDHREHGILHRFVMPDGTVRQSKFLRWARTCAYAFVGLAGISLLVSGIFVPRFGTTATMMSAFLAVGGLLSSLGALTLRWAGEFLGLPLLMSAFVVFAILTLRNDYGAAPYIANANAALLMGFAIIMSARWRVVLAVYRTADRFSGKKTQP